MKTKRILSFICVLALALSLCATVSFAAQPEAEDKIEAEVTPRYTGYGTVTSTRTYLYNSASTSSGYAYNGVIPVGTQVYVYSTTNDGEFHRIRVRIDNVNYTGYVFASHITRD